MPNAQAVEESKAMIVQPTVVVVEQDERTREFLEILLNEMDCHTLGYASSEVGVDDIARVAPTLIMLDLRRVDPDSTILLLCQLRAHPTTSHTQIVVSTTDPRLLDELEAPLNHLKCKVFTKPFDFESFIHTLEEHLYAFQQDSTE